jgi:hypothetical protein
MPAQYALTGEGKCMEPLILDGTVLVMDKGQPPKRGDVVSLFFTRDAAARWGAPGLVKRLAMNLPATSLPSGAFGLVVVEQINPPRQYVIPSGDILAVHKCVGSAVSTGTGQAAFDPRQKVEWAS